MKRENKVHLHDHITQDIAMLAREWLYQKAHQPKEHISIVKAIK
jgi:hypothetical protein